MKKAFLFYTLLIAFSTFATAQEKSNKELRADEHFAVFNYPSAIDGYSTTKELTNDGQRKLAVSYHKTHQEIKAEEAYLILMNLPSVTAEDHFDYAMVLKANGKYSEANKQLDQFAKQRPNDLRARSYINTNDALIAISKENGRYAITNLDANTSANDYAPGYYKNQIVFASDRSGPKLIVKKYSWTGRPFGDIYGAEIKGDQLKKPENFDKKLNGVLHDGPVSFNGNADYIAFTRNNPSAKKDDIVTIQIWFSYFLAGKWSDPKPFNLNSSTYNVGQPFLTADGQTMYFTSDMPGGFGGSDIYKVTKITEGDWGSPMNLGNSVNTESDEMFPFYDGKNEQLYFSSNGHNGLGGLDIFTCQTYGAKISKAYNLGYPMNTQYDDFAGISDNSMKSGYFSSNRPTGKGGDDLYSFEVLKPLPIGKKLLGKVNDSNHTAIPTAFVSLGDENESMLDTMTTDEVGDFCFLVDANKNFTLTGQKANYLDGKTTANTFGKEVIVRAEIILNSADTATKEEKELEVVTSLNPIYFDVDKFNIREDAKPGLDKVVEFLQLNPNTSIDLSAYTDCRESKYYNQVLSDKRANAVVNYLKKRTTNPKRITGKGYGESGLVTNCECEGNEHSSCSEADHQKNRRTEFRIVN